MGHRNTTMIAPMMINSTTNSTSNLDNSTESGIIFVMAILGSFACLGCMACIAYMRNEKTSDHRIVPFQQEPCNEHTSVFVFPHVPGMQKYHEIVARLQDDNVDANLFNYLTSFQYHPLPTTAMFQQYLNDAIVVASMNEAWKRRRFVVMHNDWMRE